LGYVQFCSNKCKFLNKTKQRMVTCKCLCCNKEIRRQKSVILKNKESHVFCSRSCAAKYNNQTHPKRKKIIKEPKAKIPKNKKPSVCYKCNKPLNNENTYGKNKSRCKECDVKLHMQIWKSKKNAAIIALGNVCYDCNKQFTPELYDFHHLDPTIKKYSWTKLKLKNIDIINNELKNCVLLCGNCHRLRHIKMFAKTMEEFTNKTNIIEQDGFCKYCGEKLTPTNSYKKHGKLSTHTCKCCVGQIRKIQIYETKKHILESFNNQCFDCKESFPLAMYEFHHLNPHTKNNNWSNIKGRSYDNIMKEIGNERCVPLCTNCHRLRHKELIGTLPLS